jgi:hypothetical protein
MAVAASFDLAAIRDLSDWLFKGLHEFHTAKSYGERAYALAPLELNDSDYPFLQIVRQVRTFDKKSLPRLADANDAAIRRWGPNYGIRPLLDMIGLIQELGSRSLAEHLSDLTLPSTLNRLAGDERGELVAGLVEALIPQSEFRFNGPLYPAFVKLATGTVALPESVLARALAELVTKTPADWQNILRDCIARLKTKFDVDPAESPLSLVFFAIEAGLPREHFIDLFKTGGQFVYQAEDLWTIPWFFRAKHVDRPELTPLRIVTSNRESYWVGFASRLDDKIELKKDDLRGALLHALDQEVRREAVRDESVTPLAVRARAASRNTVVEETAEESQREDIDLFRAALKPQSMAG